jgi:hypothetical protein
MTSNPNEARAAINNEPKLKLEADSNLPNADELIQKPTEECKPVRDFGPNHHGKEEGKILIKDYISTGTIDNINTSK